MVTVIKVASCNISTADSEFHCTGVGNGKFIVVVIPHVVDFQIFERDTFGDSTQIIGGFKSVVRFGK